MGGERHATQADHPAAAQRKQATQGGRVCGRRRRRRWRRRRWREPWVGFALAWTVAECILIDIFRCGVFSVSSRFCSMLASGQLFALLLLLLFPAQHAGRG